MIGINRRNLFFSFFILAAVSVTIFARLQYNGLIYNFDYGLYQPDGAHYAYRTLVLLGKDPLDSANQVSLWYLEKGFKHNNIPPSMLLPSDSETWSLVALRVAYPILSIPFVHILGIPGMLAIPILSYILLLTCVLFYAQKSNSYIHGLFLVFYLTCSITITRWMISNLTDSLLTVLFAVAGLILFSDRNRHLKSFLLILIVIVSSFTRFCLPIWIAVAIVLIINKRAMESVSVLTSSLVSAGPTLISAPENAFLPGEQIDNFLDKAIAFVFSLGRVAFYELAQLAVMDRFLFAFLIIALLASIATWKEFSSQLFLAVLAAVWAIGALNGTVGVNFRYQLPVLFFMAAVLLNNVGKLRNWVFGGKLNIIRGEA